MRGSRENRNDENTREMQMDLPDCRPTGTEERQSPFPQNYTLKRPRDSPWREYIP